MRRTQRRNAVQWLFPIWLWCTDVSTTVSCWFRKRNITCNNQKCQLLCFRIREISGGESLLWKPVTAMEISQNPSKYLPCCYLFTLIMYLIIQYFMISRHLVFSPCPQSIYIYIYILTGCEILFSLCKSILKNISEKATTEFSQFAFSHDRCKSSHRPILFDESKFEQQVSSNTL